MDKIVSENAAIPYGLSGCHQSSSSAALTDANQFTGAPSAMVLCIAVSRSVPRITTGSSAQHSAQPLPAHMAPRWDVLEVACWARHPANSCYPCVLLAQCFQNS